MLHFRFIPSMCVLCVCSAAAQVAPANNVVSVPPAVSSIDQVAQATNADLGRIRVDKWKTDGSIKDQEQHNAESLQRSFTGALPGLTAQVRANPNDPAAMFKLYRTVVATYDVLHEVAESAGAFGPKQEYDALSRDVQQFDQARHDLADAVEQATQRQTAELTQIRNAQLAAQQAAANAPPKKIIVDDTTTPTKKRTAKKKAAAKSASGSTGTAANSSGATSNNPK
ncbi:MAG TPA: hypothetical protein VGC88_03895 [Terriglobales bacterium]